MARLLLLRHAKSAWGDPTLRDFDRPLNLRGRASAPLMGRHMADHRLAPDRVLCSSARRTRETFAGILPFFATDLSAHFVRRLYETTEAGYLKTIRDLGGPARTLLVIGHNPTIQSFALSMIDRGNPELTEQIREKYPTAGLAVIDVDGDDWSKLVPGTGRIVAFFRPRELELVGGEETEEVDD